MIRIAFFGKLRAVLGDEREVAEVQGESVAALRGRLAVLFPQAADVLLGRGVRACIGDTIVGEEFVVAGHERVEFFPPLSGG